MLFTDCRSLDRDLRPRRGLRACSDPFERLKRNVALNGFPSITINGAAVARSQGGAIASPSTVECNDERGSLVSLHDSRQGGEAVLALSIDEVVSKVPRR